MRKMLQLVLMLSLSAGTLAAGGMAPQVPPQTEAPGLEKPLTESREQPALAAALNTQDPAARAAAIQEFLKRFPHSAARVKAMVAAMDAYQLAGDLANAETMAVAILKLEPGNARALALLASLSPAKTPADPLAARICAAVKNNDPAEFSLYDLELMLQYRDASPCNRGAADLAWEQILRRQGPNKILLRVKILSGTTDTIEAANMDRGVQTVPDLRIKLQVPLPAEPPLGAETAVVGRITGYEMQSFALVIEEAELRLGCDITPKKAPNVPFRLREYFLAYRDATPCTQQAADLIWAAMRHGVHGVSAKVVAATDSGFDAAIVDHGWTSSIADLHLTMAKPLRYIPPPGTTVKFSGVFEGYSTRPFQFAMVDGKSPGLFCEWIREVHPATLTFEDVQYILDTIGETTCYAGALDRIWQAIMLRHQQDGGRMMLKVSASTPYRIEGVIVYDNHVAYQLGAEVAMAKPMSHAPVEGAIVGVKGKPAYHKLRPFICVVTKGELAD